MPFFGDELAASVGVLGIIEKAYAKLRYCYKGILGVGIQQVIGEITSMSSKKLVFERKEKYK